jgi:hypothetical protein
MPARITMSPTDHTSHVTFFGLAFCFTIATMYGTKATAKIMPERVESTTDDVVIFNLLCKLLLELSYTVYIIAQNGAKCQGKIWPEMRLVLGLIKQSFSSTSYGKLSQTYEPHCLQAK